MTRLNVQHRSVPERRGRHPASPKCEQLAEDQSRVQRGAQGRPASRHVHVARHTVEELEDGFAETVLIRQTGLRATGRLAHPIESRRTLIRGREAFKHCEGVRETLGRRGQFLAAAKRQHYPGASGQRRREVFGHSDDRMLRFCLFLDGHQLGALTRVAHQHQRRAGRHGMPKVVQEFPRLGCQGQRPGGA